MLFRIRHYVLTKFSHAVPIKTHVDQNVKIEISSNFHLDHLPQLSC